MLKWLMAILNAALLGIVVVGLLDARQVPYEGMLMAKIFFFFTAVHLFIFFLKTSEGKQTLLGLWIELQKKKIKAQLDDE